MRTCENCYHQNFNYTSEKLECFNMVPCSSESEWKPSYEELERQLNELKSDNEELRHILRVNR
jgi:hypothetical protein